MKNPRPNFSIGNQFKLSDDALDNYGEELRSQIYTVTQWYNHDISIAEYKKGLDNDPHGHPGFDESAGTCLYGSTFRSDLYEWEMILVPTTNEGEKEEGE